ncbi:hypothetical protein Bca101_058904 [Brassica carinata]
MHLDRLVQAILLSINTEEKKLVKEGDGRSNSINEAIIGGSFKACIHKSCNQVSTH